MINDIARKSIHVDAPNNVPVAQIKEYDDFILKLALMKYNTPFDCTGQAATLGAKAPSGLFEQTTDITINKDQIDIKLKTGIVSKSGICEMELKLVDSTGSMTTASFFIAVNRKILNDEAVEASDEFDSLTKSVQKINADYEALRGGLLASDKVVYFQDEINKTNKAINSLDIKKADNARIDEIVAHNGDGTKDTELIDARKGKASMRAKVDEMDMKSESNATKIADIVKYQANSNKDYEGVEHENLNARLIADYIMMMDRFNKARLLPYESEFISASNTYEGKTRELVVKGRTLQNLAGGISIQATGGTIVGETIVVDTTTSATDGGIIIEGANLVKPNSKYTFIYEVVSNAQYSGMFSMDGAEPYCFQVQSLPVTAGTHKVVLTSKATWTVPKFKVATKSSQGEGKLVVKTKMSLLEGDWTNKQIPSYFEGIKSVNEDSDNLEVVSRGKNLFDSTQNPITGPGTTIININNGIKVKGLWYGGYLIPKLDKSKKYFLQFNREVISGNGSYVILFNQTLGMACSQSCTVSSLLQLNDKYNPNHKIAIYFYAGAGVDSNCEVNFTNVQLEVGSTATAYEPYKKHCLPIKMKTLRGLPNGTCDTSDGVRRIGKVVLNGSENWQIISVTSPNTIILSVSNFLDCVVTQNNANIMSDKFLNKYVYALDEEGVFTSRASSTSKGNIYIRILKSKLTTLDITGFKSWLKANPITVYYELAEPIKEEGNTEELRTYDGQTHIFTEGSLIEPTISCKVPSNVQAVVMNLRSENEALNNDVNTLQATAEENNLMNIETNVNQEARLTMLELGVI